ncbi:MAG: hypothetical protein IT363_00440 [Methanoregulaceae archaeon]|nr:hypothetical protein [Methanoregulaceae archaeon]
MIHIKVDPNIIPAEVLKAAQHAAESLEKEPEENRTDFIKKRSHIWSAFKESLRVMSHGKCWYSEARESQSFMAVDHFRPKNAAKRSETEEDKPGYQWLAFDWANYRLAADCSNTATWSDTGTLDGKNEWFPLLGGSPKATWAERCVSDEKPLLIDPTNEEDVRLVDVAEDGLIVPTKSTVGTAAYRVKESARILGLNHGRIKEARVRKMREINEWLNVLEDLAVLGQSLPPDRADLLPVAKVEELVRSACRPESEFSLAARKTVESRYPALLR